jgi:curved DNA-binding protein
MKIKPGSTNGSKLRLKGRGIPGKPPGDLYVILGIALPAATTDRAKEIYKDMQQALDFNPRARLGV